MTDNIEDRLDCIERTLRRRELIYDAREQVGWLEIEQLNALFEYLRSLHDAAPQLTQAERDLVARHPDVDDESKWINLSHMTPEEMVAHLSDWTISRDRMRLTPRARNRQNDE